VASSLLENISCHVLFHGNVDVASADAAADLLEGLMTASGGGVLPKKKFYYQFVAKIPLSTEPLLVTVPPKDLESGNTAVEVYFQVGKDNMMDRVVIDMLIHLMAEPLYSQLRTQEQYGYRVSCDSRWTVGVMGMKFVVVTAVKSAVSVWTLSRQQ
jgi:secreted Zn-dependent insulinase-like peptidase